MTGDGARLLLGLFVVASVALSAALFGPRLASDGATAAITFAAALLGAGLVVSARRALSPRALFASLVAIRVIFAFADPVFSDDIYRYVHEGRASRLGLATPYAIPPKDITPSPDDGITARVNHPEVPAAYPPTSQLVFLVVAGLGDVVGKPLLVMKLFFVLVEIALLFLLFVVRERWPGAFVLYGVHPLPLLEVAWTAHLDGLGVLLVLAGALALQRHKTWQTLVGGALIGLACLVKPIAIIAVLAAPLSWRRAALASAGAAAGVLAPTIPYLVVDAPLTSGLVQYSTRWEAQPTGYAVIESLVEPAFVRRHARQRWTHLHVGSGGILVEAQGERLFEFAGGARTEAPVLLDERAFSRGLAGALFLIGVGLLLLRVDGRMSRVAWAFAILWLLAPTLHPWYLLWLLPFAAMTRSWPLMLYAAASPLAYEVVIRSASGEPWQEAVWPRVVALLALGAGFAYERFSRSRAPAGASAG